jgi:hypothetical protein
MEIVTWVAKYLRNYAIFENMMLSMDPDNGNRFEEHSMNSTLIIRDPPPPMKKVKA